MQRVKYILKIRCLLIYVYTVYTYTVHEPRLLPRTVII